MRSQPSAWLTVAAVTDTEVWPGSGWLSEFGRHPVVSGQGRDVEKGGGAMLTFRSELRALGYTCKLQCTGEWMHVHIDSEYVTLCV